MTRNTSSELFGFSLLDWGRSILSPSHVRVVAVCVGEESYETLRDGMKNVFAEVNGLLRDKSLTVDGEEVHLEFFLCGDMKFKQKILGLQSATATYACPACDVS